MAFGVAVHPAQPAMTRCFRILAEEPLPPDVSRRDPIAGQCFSSYNEAYDALERYYADLCCSDERIYYTIVEENPADSNAGQAGWVA